MEKYLESLLVMTASQSTEQLGFLSSLLWFRAFISLALRLLNLQEKLCLV